MREGQGPVGIQEPPWELGAGLEGKAAAAGPEGRLGGGAGAKVRRLTEEQGLAQKPAAHYQHRQN